MMIWRGGCVSDRRVFEGGRVEDMGFDLEGLVRIGPEVFERERGKGIGFGDERLRGNGLGVGKMLKGSKEMSVRRWIDDMNAMGKSKGNPGWMIAIGGDDRFLRQRNVSLMAEGSAHGSAAVHEVLSGVEDSDEGGTSSDDERTVITAIEVVEDSDEIDSNEDDVRSDITVIEVPISE